MLYSVFVIAAGGIPLRIPIALIGACALRLLIADGLSAQAERSQEEVAAARAAAVYVMDSCVEHFCQRAPVFFRLVNAIEVPYGAGLRVVRWTPAQSADLERSLGARLSQGPRPRDASDRATRTYLELLVFPPLFFERDSAVVTVGLNRVEAGSRRSEGDLTRVTLRRIGANWSVVAAKWEGSS